VLTGFGSLPAGSPVVMKIILFEGEFKGYP
jgi:hypothetical protein